MIVDSEKQTLVVGFLCESNTASNFNDDTWVEIEGTITKGDYHGEIPIIKITYIKEIQKPTDEFVSAPDPSYIPTSILF